MSHCKSLLAASLLIVCFWTRPSLAQEPGWASDVLLPPATQQRLDAVPILNRPYRPLHFYGNTVRRLHYRGRVLPTRHDLRNTRQHLSRRQYVPVTRYLW